MFVNFRIIFFSSSSGELLLKNVNRASMFLKEKLSKAGRFSSQDKVFIWKILSWLSQDPASNKRNPTWPGRMKNVTASYKLNLTTILWRNDWSCLIASIVTSRLLSRPGSHINIPLVWSIFLHKKLVWSCKTYVYKLMHTLYIFVSIIIYTDNLFFLTFSCWKYLQRL